MFEFAPPPFEPQAQTGDDYTEFEEPVRHDDEEPTWTEDTTEEEVPMSPDEDTLTQEEIDEVRQELRPGVKAEVVRWIKSCGNLTTF